MLVRDGLELRYEVHGGSGPALLLPHLNFSWPDYLDLRPFTEHFTVITASPRGFGTSSRLDADNAYRVRDMADDLVAVVQEVGFDRFVVLGYSFTGAFAPWIAQLTGRADAVVSGGFPIVGDYAYLYPEIHRQSEAAKSDPAAWARVDAAFDNQAALSFYRELSELPADSLVSDLPCPLLAFWGDQDEEMGPWRHRTTRLRPRPPRPTPHHVPRPRPRRHADPPQRHGPQSGCLARPALAPADPLDRQSPGAACCRQN
jgi:pimeloyl-ACP methyl ester carboxylesterase